MKVAVAVIKDPSHRILIAQHTRKDHYHLLWEFPGGKLESGETPHQALKRELNEELGIHVISATFWMHYAHYYQQQKISLFIFRVIQYNGVAKSLENQNLQWLPLDALQELNLLPGNHIILKALEKDHQPH